MQSGYSYKVLKPSPEELAEDKYVFAELVPRLHNETKKPADTRKDDLFTESERVALQNTMNRHQLDWKLLAEKQMNRHVEKWYKKVSHLTKQH